MHDPIERLQGNRGGAGAKRPAFVKALAHEAAALLRNGEPETAKQVLRDLATSGKDKQRQEFRRQGIEQGMATSDGKNQ